MHATLPARWLRFHTKWKFRDVAIAAPMYDDDGEGDGGGDDDGDICRTGVVNAPRLVARSHPLPLTEAEGIVLDVFLEILAALFLLVPLCFLAAAYCINPGESSTPHPTGLLPPIWRLQEWS